MKKLLILLLSLSFFSLPQPILAATETFIIQAEEPTSYTLNGVIKQNLDIATIGHAEEFPQYYNNGTPQATCGETGDGIAINPYAKAYSVTLRRPNTGIDSLTYSINVKSASEYTLNVYLCTWCNIKLSASINGEDAQAVSLPRNMSTWVMTDGIDNFTGVASYVVNLNAGSNTILLTSTNDLFIDRLELSHEVSQSVESITTQAEEMASLTQNGVVKELTQSALGNVADFPKYYATGDVQPIRGETGEGVKIATWGTKVYAITLRPANKGIDKVTYNVEVETAGTYVLSMRTGVWGSTTPVIKVNGATLPSVTLERNLSSYTDSGDVFAENVIGSVNLRAGVNAVEVTTNAAFFFDSFTFTSTTVNTKEVEYFVNDKASDKISNGALKVKANHGVYGDAKVACGAIYVDGSLSCMLLQNVNGTATSTTFDFGDFASVSEARFKYFMFSSIQNLTPATKGVTPTSTPTPTPSVTPTPTPTAAPTSTPTPAPTIAPGTTADIYVSVNGSDTNNGKTALTPVKSIAKAITLAEAQKGNSTSFKVSIGAGKYYLDDILTLTTKDSNMTIEGAGINETIISGGKPVSGWASAGNGIYYANVDTTDVREFYVNDVPAVRARNNNATSGTNGRLKAVSCDGNGIVVNTSDIPSELISNPAGVELKFDILWNRYMLRVSGATKNSNGTTLLSITDDVWKKFYAARQNKWADLPCGTATGAYSTTRFYYWIENHKSLLDTPGEFYYDKNAKRLYYYPRNGENLTSSNCYIGYLSSPASAMVSNGDTNTANMIYIDGTKNLTIKNITFEGGTWLYPSVYSNIPMSQDGLIWTPTDTSSTYGMIMPAQIQMRNTNNVVLDGIRMHNCAGYGVGMGTYTVNCAVKNSTFENLGGGAVYTGYHRNSNKSDNTLVNRYMTLANNSIINNNISHVATEQAGCPAIKVWHASNITISHNTIQNTGYSGISVGWGWHAQLLSNTVNSGGHTIDSNYVDNVCLTLEDGAPFYSLGYFANEVSVTNNVFANSNDGICEIPPVTNLGYHGAVYCDEGSFNITFKNNVMVGALQWASSRYGAVNGNIKFDGVYTNVPQVCPNIPEYTSNGALNPNCNYYGYHTNDYNFDGTKVRHISTTLTNFNQITNDVWPSVAQNIIANAGVQ